MLQRLNLIRKGLPVGNNTGVVGMLPEAVSELKFVGFDVRLQIQAKDRLLALNNEERKNLTQERASVLAFAIPHKLRAMVSVALGMIVDVKRSFELLSPSHDDRLVGHANSGNDLPANMRAVRLGVSSYSDVSLSVEQSSSVSKFHKSSSVVTDMSANSGNTQNGQSRTKQAERPGVRREQVPTAKAKICSELRRDTQTSTEMFEGHHVGARNSLHDELTECNTDYIFFRPHRDRNFVPIGGERQAVNQDAVVKLIGWAGNMTSSGPQFSGVLIA